MKRGNCRERERERERERREGLREGERQNMDCAGGDRSPPHTPKVNSLITEIYIYICSSLPLLLHVIHSSFIYLFIYFLIYKILPNSYKNIIYTSNST